MSPVAAQRLRLAAVTMAVGVLVIALAAGWVYRRVRASLPQLDGTARVAGLGAAVSVERDALGIPTLRGGDRRDLARALGWLHAQDRFFQMDLLRRSAAGELAELLGERALARDRTVRLHGFRRLAQAVLARLSGDDRALLEAYAAGANAGLAALAEPPFEYLFLREAPQPWRAEDSLLASYAMVIDLQDETARYERSLMTLRDTYGFDAPAFFAPVVTAADAALDGSTAAPPPIPGPRVINLRAAKVGSASAPAAVPGAGRALFETVEDTDGLADLLRPEGRSRWLAGSNAFALAGAHTATGAALLANDMHLGHAVPNIWYRASLEYGGRKITGVTLPGAPFVVVGSNGHVAWGFTHAPVDTGDLVVVETNSIAKNLYKAPGHADFLAIERRQETIRVKGKEPVVADYEWTVWGPIVGRNDRERPLAHRWVAHEVEAMNVGVIGLEKVQTVDEAIAAAHGAGISTVNLIVADRAGDIAWTLAGRLPKRIGYDGRLPVTWSFGDRKWDGLLPAAEVPVVRGADSVLPGRIWSGNQRQVGGEALARLGDGGYADPPRAAQIRDRLATLSRAAPADLLAVQLDDRALFLEPWQRRLLDVLTPAVTQASPARAELRRLAEKWEGRASAEAVSYRLVRAFHRSVTARVFGPLFAPCRETMADFDSGRFHLEPALAAILQERPLHLLEARYGSWDDLLVAAADDVIASGERAGLPLAQSTWGERNRARIRHPFSGSVPLLGRWLDLPADPLPGDADMPRVQGPSHGASQRMVVSPGREAEGLFHMPGGQSAHPLSAFFQAGHSAWVRGEPTPFLPGPALHRLTLQP